MMELKVFVSDIFRINSINKVISDTFPKLNNTHRALLSEYLTNLLNIIAVIFGFDQLNRTVLEHQLSQNNYRDLTGILLLLLPHINEDEENTKKKNIKSLDDIYVDKESDIDPNNGEPVYKYSNIQYGRCNRGSNNNFITEVHFDKSHLQQNYYLLLETLYNTSNKLYINWYNVRPFSLNTFKKSYLYKTTYSHFQNGTIEGIWKPENMLEMLSRYNGLSMVDIYETIHHDLYLSIDKIKWILYDVENTSHIKYPLIIIMNELMDLTNALNGILWDDLSEYEKYLFKHHWHNMLMSARESHNFYTSTFSVSYDTIRTIEKAFIIFFNKYYNNMTEAISSGYKQFNIKQLMTLPEDDDDEERENETVHLSIGFDQLEESIESLTNNNVKFVYDYIRQCLQKLIQSWYRLRLIESSNENIRIVKHDTFDKLMINNKVLTLKNIYNYSKSFCSHKHDITHKFTPYPRFWKSLSNEYKETILSRLNTIKHDKVMEWFNISRNIARSYHFQKHETDKIKKINLMIFDNIREVLIDYIFETLIIKGTLSYFTPSKELTDGLDPTNSNDRKLIMERLEDVLNDNNIRDGSYYYLNGLTYGQTKMSKIRKIKSEEETENEKKDNKLTDIKAFNYLQYNSTSDAGLWFTQYALDWVSQISFFQKYLNTRIMFITGSTGVGKSTQIPKLLLYALKVIDRRNDGKVVCTQPRIMPVDNNAARVSTELGVPIDDPWKENLYVQLSHGKRNISKNTHRLILKFMTDGMLNNELSNPVAKKTHQEKIIDQNIYDIIIVDEAHEHNINMDMILTVMKHATYYNNTIRLIIVSATMDQDESIYRRYYRVINDNYLYPTSKYLENNKLDRINVDRHLHISPPGKTTKYVIKDYFDPTININNIEDILKVIHEAKGGDILIFQPGKSDIIGKNGTVDLINNSSSIPSNIIAIPFHSDISEKQRNLIENIAKDEYRKSVRMNRTDTFDDNFDVGNRSYTQFIIVATNIAEASITINTLRAIIDTGKEKISVYDYVTGTTRLDLRSTSRSSQQQRRGRVGRTASGVVYFVYEKGSRDNIKIPYKICFQEISNTLLERLFKSPKENSIFNSNTDPNKISVEGYLEKYKRYGNASTKIIWDPYNNDGIPNSYRGNKLQYDYHNDLPPDIYYESGYSHETLTDQSGTFYIIHPEELNLRRNIIGSIVGINKNSQGLQFRDGKIYSEKMQSFWKILIGRLFVLIYNENNQNILYQSAFGNHVADTARMFKYKEITLNFVVALIYAKRYGCVDKMIKLLSLIIACQGKMIDIIGRDNKVILFDDLIKSHGEGISDIEVILKILESVENIKYTDKYKIEKWYMSHGINKNVIDKYNRILPNIISSVANIQFDWINELPVFHIKYDPLIFSLMQGFSSNIAKKFGSTPFYMSIYSPILQNMYSIPSISLSQYKPITFVKQINQSNYILYLMSDEEQEIISFICYISPDMLKYLPFVYNAEYIIALNKLQQKPLITDNTIREKYTDTYILNKYNMMLHEIKNDISSNFDRTIQEEYQQKIKMWKFKKQ